MCRKICCTHKISRRTIISRHLECFRDILTATSTNIYFRPFLKWRRLFHQRALLYKSCFENDYITDLNIKIPVQKLEHVQRFWNKMTRCGISNWLYLENAFHFSTGSDCYLWYTGNSLCKREELSTNYWIVCTLSNYTEYRQLCTCIIA